MDYVATINLVPHLNEPEEALEEASKFAVQRLETLAFSVDDAISLAGGGQAGSKIRVWNLHDFTIGDIERLNESGIDLEYRHLQTGDFWQCAKSYISEVLARHAFLSYGRRDISDIYFLTIHHTVGWNFHLPNLTNAHSIANYHVNIKGWPAIGYHFLVCPNGEILETGELETVSYHCGTLAAPGDENLPAVGICLGGDFRNGPPPDAQLSAATALVRELKITLPNQLAIIPHKRMPGASTVCPGRDGLEDWLKTVAGEDMAF